MNFARKDFPMIDSRITGAYISRLRREKDWTQQELADRLNISHQAVSRWEKGDSFPDIGTLAQMAGLFGVSVDDLLNGGPNGGRQPGGRVTTAYLLNELSRGRARDVAKMVDDDRASVESLLDAARLARPSLINEVVLNMKSTRFTADQAVELAPFVSRELFSELMQDAHGADSAAMSPERLSDAAPFLGREALDQLAQRILTGPITAGYLTGLAPFLSRSVLGGFVDRIPDETLDAEALTGLAPFVEREVMDALAIRVTPGSLDAEQLGELAPFLSRRVLGQLFDGIDANSLKIENLLSLAPFLERETLDGLVERASLGAVTTDQVTGLAPFVSRETLVTLLKKVPEGALDVHDVIALSPFLGREALEAIIRGGMQARKGQTEML
jgi:transcriptional regulator with XRE-family HTH domain